MAQLTSPTSGQRYYDHDSNDIDIDDINEDDSSWVEEFDDNEEGFIDEQAAWLIDNQLLGGVLEPSGFHADDVGWDDGDCDDDGDGDDSSDHHLHIPEADILSSSQLVAQQLIDYKFRLDDDDDEGRDNNSPYSDGRFHQPFEISSSPQSSSFHYRADSSRSNSRSSSPPFSGLPLERSAFYRYLRTKRSLRAAKIIVALVIAVILAAIALLIMKNTFASSSDSPGVDDGNDGIHDQSAPSVNKSNSWSPDTTIEKSPDDDDDDDDDDEYGKDEPNPPDLPHSMKLFHPPKNDAEIETIRKALARYSDSPITWEEFSKNGNNNNSNNNNKNNNNDDDEPLKKPENYPDRTYTTKKHFSEQRTALLFAPGEYPQLDFQIGYYTSVLGLGKHPDDVRFTDCDKGPHTPALEKFTNRPPHGSGLDTFWRSIENIATEAREGLQWTVSQAAPLRRMHILGDLNLYDGESWVSGGVAANILVDGKVDFGGQQQWLMRNVELSEPPVNGAWSLVFVGCTGSVPEESDGMMGGPSVTVEDKPDVRVEKPYIVLKKAGRSMMDKSQGRRTSKNDLDNAEQHRGLDDGETYQHQFELRVPAVTFEAGASGTQFEDMDEDVRDFRRVKLGIPSKLPNPADAAIENHSVLQRALDNGKDLVLSPGIYHLSQSLRVKYDNQVVLGLGYATLIAPDNGSPCIKVHSWVSGVRIAGIMLEASVITSKTDPTIMSLLEWGTPEVNDPGDASNPGALSDVFCRVGGLYRDVSTDVMIQLYSGNIYGDNLWLWRADHVQLRRNEEPNFPQISLKYRQVTQGECKVKNGLTVDAGATNVTIVGLAVEHTTEDQTIWNGNNGRVYFYQSELPYDADHTFREKNYVGFRVGSQVTDHKALGLGIYSNFRDHDVEVATAVVHPTNEGIKMRNIFTVKLDNEGSISSVVNGLGPGPTIKTERGHPYRCSDETCSNANK